MTDFGNLATSNASLNTSNDYVMEDMWSWKCNTIYNYASFGDQLILAQYKQMNLADGSTWTE